MNPDEYCQQKAAQSGSSFYYSFMFLPATQRRAITAMYAFCREADDTVDECADPTIAEARLNWWHSEVKRLFDNAPSHPVTKALASVMDQFNFHKEHMDEILDGMSMDLNITHYESFDDLMLYCHRAAGVVGLLAAEIFGYKNDDTLKFAENLGIAFQLTNIIRDVKEDALRGRIYLPMEDLRAHQVEAEDLSADVTSENTRALIRFQVERAQEYYNKAFELLPPEDRYSQRSSLIMSSIYQTILNEIIKDNYKVMEYRIKLTPLRKLWIAWRTYRRENKLHKKSCKQNS